MRHEIKFNPMNSNTVHQASNHKSFKGPRIFYKTYRKTIKVTLVNRDSRRKNNHAPRAVEKSSREESVPARGSWLGDIESYTLARRASIPRRFQENEETSRKERERIEREGREGGREKERERAVAREEAHECTGGRELKSCGRDAVDPEKREERWKGGYSAL